MLVQITLAALVNSGVHGPDRTEIDRTVLQNDRSGTDWIASTVRLDFSFLRHGSCRFLGLVLYLSYIALVILGVECN